MSKQEIYENLLPQVFSLVQDEGDLVANMANVAAVLHEAFGFWWTGFYLVKAKGRMANGESDGAQEPELVLGPFQGPIACTRIPYGKGVCGTSWQRRETVIVPDVHQFPGHIACSSLSQSEIVVPVVKAKGEGAQGECNGEEVIAVLDIDSKELNTFDETDRYYLEQIAKCLA